MNPTAALLPEVAGPQSPGPKHPVVVATSTHDGTVALHAARVIAAQCNAPVVALSVVEPAATALYQPDYRYLSPEYDAIRASARFADIRRQVAAVAGPDAGWDTPIRLGSPDAAITEEAKERDAALIVMDSGRHNWIARLLVGETTLRTIRWAPCPVLAVGATFDNLPRVAVAAIDFSPSSIAAARSALALLHHDATLYLVHVWRRSPSDHPSERERDDAYEQRLTGSFERLVATLGAPDSVTVRWLSLLGEPVDRLLEFAASHGADLIAAGRRGHGFFERLLIGSVTTALVRGSECSVLVTPDPPLAEADRLARSVTGIFETRVPADWAPELAAFSRRNQGRRTVLEADDPTIGHRIHVRGYSLLGAAYDHNDRRAALMLGESASGGVHITHSMTDVTLVAIRSAVDGKDEALLVAHGGGWAMLSFPSTDAAAPADRAVR